MLFLCMWGRTTDLVVLQSRLPEQIEKDGLRARTGSSRSRQDHAR